MSLSILLVLGVALSAGLLRGGSLASLADTRLRWLVLLFEGLLIQVAFDIWDPPGLTASGGLAVLLVSNVAVAGFLVLNARIPGMLLIGLGLLLNSLVITANQAMPVSATAAARAGLEPPPVSSDDIKHERLDSSTRLGWLGDVIAVPGLKEVLSLGDVVLALGVGRVVYMQSTERRRAKTRPDEASD